MSDGGVPVLRNLLDLMRPLQPRFPIPTLLIPLSIDTNKPKKKQLSVWAMSEIRGNEPAPLATGDQTVTSPKKLAKKLNSMKLETKASPSRKKEKLGKNQLAAEKSSIVSPGHLGRKEKPGKNQLPAEQVLPGKPEPSEIPSKSPTQTEQALTKSGPSRKKEKGAVLTKQESLTKQALTEEGLDPAEQSSRMTSGESLVSAAPASPVTPEEDLEPAKQALPVTPRTGNELAEWAEQDTEGFAEEDVRRSDWAKKTYSGTPGKGLELAVKALPVVPVDGLEPAEQSSRMTSEESLVPAAPDSPVTHEDDLEPAKQALPVTLRTGNEWAEWAEQDTEGFAEEDVRRSDWAKKTYSGTPGKGLELAIKALPVVPVDGMEPAEQSSRMTSGESLVPAAQDSVETPEEDLEPVEQDLPVTPRAANEWAEWAEQDTQGSAENDVPMPDCARINFSETPEEGQVLAGKASPETPGEGLKLVQHGLPEASGDNLEFVKLALQDSSGEDLELARQVFSDLMDSLVPNLQALMETSGNYIEADTTSSPAQSGTFFTENKHGKHGKCLTPDDHSLGKAAMAEQAFKSAPHSLLPEIKQEKVKSDKSVFLPVEWLQPAQAAAAEQASTAPPGSSGKELKQEPAENQSSANQASPATAAVEEEPLGIVPRPPQPEDVACSVIRPAAISRPIYYGLGINLPAGTKIGALIQETGGLIYESQPCRSLTEAGNAADERIDLDESDDRRVTRMHLAAYHGNLIELEELIQDDSGVLRKRNVKNGYTPIFYAVYGDTDSAAICIIMSVGDSGAGESPGIEGGAKGLLRARSNKGYTPLGLACCLGKTEIAKKLIKYGADIKMRTDILNSMLHLAAENGNLILVKQFLQAGLHVDTFNVYNMTPLHYAVFFSHAKVVEYLLAKGANVNYFFRREREGDHDFGLTSLMLAAFNGNVEITKMLLDGEADLRMVDEYGMTALQLAAENGHVKVVDMLLDVETRIGVRGKDLFNAIHRAVIRNHTDVVALLVKWCSPDVKIHTACNGSTALHMAARYGYLETVKVLINERSVKLNLRDYDCCTPLMIAIKFGHAEVALAILAKKTAEVNKRDTSGYTPLHLAAYTGYSVEVVRALIGFGANKDAMESQEFTMGITPLHVAVYAGHKPIVRTLLELGADISLTNREQWTALHMCAVTLFTDMANILLDHGASIDARSSTGSTPLMVAVDTGRMEVVNTLIDRGANINAADKTGYTALHFAAERGHLVAADSLVKRGARLEERTVDMRATPLYLAAKNGHVKIVVLLLRNNVDVNQIVKYDMTPLHVAVENCHTPVVRSLIFHGTQIDPIANFNDERYVPLKYAQTLKHNGIKQLFSFIYALFHAVENNNLKDVFHLTMKKLVPFNCRSHKHGTPLLLAAKKGYRNMTAHLVDIGSMLDQFDVDGMSPLHYAVQHNWYHLMLLMLRRGANFDQVYMEGCPVALEIDVRTIEVGPLDPLQMEERDKILWFMKTLKKAFAMADKGDEEVLNLIQTVRDRNNWEFLVIMKARRFRNIQLIDAALQAGHIALAIKLSDLKKEAKLACPLEQQKNIILPLLIPTS